MPRTNRTEKQIKNRNPKEDPGGAKSKVRVAKYNKTAMQKDPDTSGGFTSYFDRNLR